jgi:hypothetical protein
MKVTFFKKFNFKIILITVFLLSFTKTVDAISDKSLMDKKIFIFNLNH